MAEVASADPRAASPRALGDLWGGVAASAIVLPQAMAFGATLLAPAGRSAAEGAAAGLVAAALLSLASGLARGTRGLISAPTGPTLVLAAAALSSLTAAGLHGDALLTGFTAVLMCAGLTQVIIGLSGGGRLIQFIPYPVISGFMTGSAVLMILSQQGPLGLRPLDGLLRDGRWLPVATALVTFVAVRVGPRLLRAIPGTISGLVAGTLFHHLMLNAAGVPPLPAATVGSLPGLRALRFGFDTGALGALPWPTIVASAVALAVLASLDTLLTSVIADVATGSRHRPARELAAQGLGHLAAAVAGGMAGAGTTGATVTAIRSGGRRYAGVFAGLVFALLVAVLGPAGRLLPLGALAGIIIAVALGLVERDVFGWIRRRGTRADAFIAVLVTVVTVAWDLMIAVGLGVAIAIVTFIRQEIGSPVVVRRSTAATLRSVRGRSQEQRQLLDQHGERIVLVELRGNLFFAKADQLFDQLVADLDRPVWLILHMRRVTGVDLTGLRILLQIADRLHAHGGELIFCEVHRGAGLGASVAEVLRDAATVAPTFRAPPTFNGSDEALEYAEDALLTELELPAAATDTQVSLADADFARDLSADQVAALASHVVRRSVAAGSVLFHKGDPGASLFIVGSGALEVRLPTTLHHYKRLAAYGPGSLFGAVAFLDPGPRAAEVIATADCELWELDRRAFDDLARDSPSTAIALLFSLGTDLGRNLRWSTLKIRDLSQW